MLKDFTTNLQKASADDLYEISLRSAMAKSGEIYIFEKSEMSDLFDKERVEKVRQMLLENKIKVRQITNIENLPKFTDNDEFANKVMTFRHVPKDIFDIQNEIVIFDDIVAIYNNNELLVIEDKSFAGNQKQLFLSIWEQGHSPKLGFDYKPNHSFYNSIDYHLDEMQIIIWPDADAGKAYDGFSEERLGEYIKDIIRSDTDYSESTYVIAFMWSFNGEKMLDVWRFDDNHVDDRSGPLGNVKVYREGKPCSDLGLASGNTLLVLGYEEKLRRQSKNLKSYLAGPAPNLPLEIMNGKSFF